MSNNTFCLIFILAFLNASQQRCPMCTCDGKREQSEIVIYGTEHTDWYRLCLQYVANINICLRYSDCVCKFTLVLSSVHTGVWSSISQPIFGPLQPWSRLWGPKQSCSPYIYNILLLQPNSWFTSYWRPILMKEWPLNNSWTIPGSMWVFQLNECISLDVCFFVYTRIQHWDVSFSNPWWFPKRLSTPHECWQKTARCGTRSRWAQTALPNQIITLPGYSNGKIPFRGSFPLFCVFFM